jgi:hypothetical protein
MFHPPGSESGTDFLSAADALGGAEHSGLRLLETGNEMGGNEHQFAQTHPLYLGPPQ